MNPIAGQINTVWMALEDRSDGDPITSGTVSIFLYAVTGTNAGKWWDGQGSTWSATEAAAAAMTHVADGQWYAAIAAAAWLLGVEYRYYAKEGSNLHAVNGRSVRAGLDVDADLRLIRQAIAGQLDHDVTLKTDRIFDETGGILRTLQRAETITVTEANWTNATKRITQSGVFAAYLFQLGDVFALTDGTGATPAQYIITAKIDDNTIELSEDINGEGTDITDSTVAGEIVTGRLMRTVVAD